jgi:hypothetical protein
MKLPETIIIKAVGEGDLSDIIFELGVMSGTKNRYWIVFPKTNAKGITSLTREQFRGQFEDH